MIIVDDQAHQQMTLTSNALKWQLDLKSHFVIVQNYHSTINSSMTIIIITFMPIQIYNRTSYSNCYSLLQSLHPQCSVERQLANIANNLMSIKIMIMQQ